MDFLKRYVWWTCSFVVAVILVGGYALAFAPPPDFSSDRIVVIVRGASVSEISKQLSDANIIKYPTILSLLLRISGAGSSVKSGAYLFKSPENIFAIANRLTTGAYGLPPVRLTFPEGETARNAAERVANAFHDISTANFLSVAQPYEGYLFPDTYLFSPSANAESIVATMRKNFNTKIASSSSLIAASGHSLSDIVIMASLVEKEARSTEVRHIVAGILWSRLKRGMPLQVDAVFGYINNRDTYSPLLSDLTIESPYNLYLHTGLPPGPIANPGLESIDAVLRPTKTKYLYYLTDKNGVMHYATTYAEHQSNQHKYLK